MRATFERIAETQPSKRTARYIGKQLVYVVVASNTFTGQQCELNTFKDGNDTFRCRRTPLSDAVSWVDLTYDDMQDELTRGTAAGWKFVGTAAAFRETMECPTTHVSAAHRIALEHMMTWNRDSSSDAGSC